MKCGRSKSGLPTVEECGGGLSNTGSAQVICGENGEKLKPLFVVPRGKSNGTHAIFVAKVGYHVLSAWHSRNGEGVTVKKIITITDDDSIIFESIGEYENGDSNIPEKFNDAVNTCLRKSKSYHCRSPFYIAS